MTTADEFWNHLGAYSAAAWPVQVVWLTSGAIRTYLIFAKRTPRANRTMRALLSSAFAWNGDFFLPLSSDGLIHGLFSCSLHLYSSR